MNKFVVRDLINAGLFSVLVVTAFWCAGMIGFIPVTMPIVPFLCAMVSAPVFMLYSTKIDKFGMVIILGIIVALVFSMSGHGIYVVPGTIVLSLIAEFILKKGEYKSIRHARWAYTVFVALSGFNLIPMFVARESYHQYLVESGYGQEFADKIMSVLPNWSFGPIVLLGCFGGYIGCTIGIKMLNKHFKKAGMM